MSKWKIVQQMLGITVDGIPGEKTAQSVIDVLSRKAEFKGNILPQSSIRLGKSCYGTAGKEDNLVNVCMPVNYPLRYEGQIVKSIRVHRLVADRVTLALGSIVQHYLAQYGTLEDCLAKVPAIYQYGGSYNNRTTVGGSVKSMHAWGLALDFDPENNAYSTSARGGARLAKPEYRAFFDIWQKYGFFSLGRYADKDWMHIQAATWD